MILYQHSLDKQYAVHRISIQNNIQLLMMLLMAIGYHCIVLNFLSLYQACAKALLEWTICIWNQFNVMVFSLYRKLWLRVGNKGQNEKAVLANDKFRGQRTLPEMWAVSCP